MDAEMVEAIVVIADALIDLFDQHCDLKLWQSTPLGKAVKFSWGIHFSKGDFMETEMKVAIGVIAKFLVDILKK